MDIVSKYIMSPQTSSFYSALRPFVCVFCCLFKSKCLKSTMHKTKNINYLSPTARRVFAIENSLRLAGLDRPSNSGK